MYIVQSGRVRVTKLVDGKTIRLGVFGKSDFFGEMAILTENVRSATAVAAADCSLTVIGRDAFLEALAAGPTWLAAMIRGMAKRLCIMDDRLGKDLVYVDRN